MRSCPSACEACACARAGRLRDSRAIPMTAMALPRISLLTSAVFYLTILDWSRKSRISQHQLAAVYFDGLAYYIAGGIRGQKSDHFRAFDGRAHAPEGNHGDEIAHHFRRREHFVKGSVDYTGRDGIHAHAVRRKFLGQ